MSATAQRDSVFAIAPVHVDIALREARQIKEPWFHVQSLAAVIRYAPESDVVALSKEAFAAARQTKDTYQQVAVSAWIIAALIERGSVSVAKPLLLNVLATSHGVTPASSKVEALLLLLNATWHSPACRQPTLDLLLQTCETADTWRRGRAMMDTVLMVAAIDREYAEVIWNRMPEIRHKRTTRRRLDADRTFTPRSFFHIR